MYIAIVSLLELKLQYKFHGSVIHCVIVDEYSVWKSKAFYLDKDWFQNCLPRGGQTRNAKEADLIEMSTLVYSPGCFYNVVKCL